ncbi:hypothetical protein ScPMuIL_003809 [Solemya velum]
MKVARRSHVVFAMRSSPGGDLRWPIYWCLLLVVVLHSVVVIESLDEYPPNLFKVEPDSQNALALGTARTLTCKATSNPAATNSWQKDGVIMSPTANLEIGNFYLTIKQATDNDNGEYRCLAGNYLGTLMSKVCTIVVSYMEEFSSAPQPVTVTAGHAAVIHLPPLESYPVPEITWKLGTAEMNTESSNHQVTFSQDLVLLQTTPLQSGNQYKVQALNVAVKKQIESDSVQLTVLDDGNTNPIPPKMIVPPADIVVKTGDSEAKFECIVNARPLSRLSILWYKVSGDTRTLLTGGDDYTLSTHHRTLTINNPRLSDEGEYQCEATLTLLQGPSIPPVSASANLTVHVTPDVSNHMPSLHSRDFGQSINIPCQVIGSPPPSIHWFFNAIEIDEQTNSRISISSDGTLTISSLDLADGGIYQCFARNQAGEAYKATWLQVNHSPPQFVTRPSNLSIVEGTDARFLCETVGAPSPAVQWFRVTSNGHELLQSQSRIQILDRGQLLIASTETSDMGLYECNSTNTIGVISAEAYLHVWVRTAINDFPVDKQSAILGSTVRFTCVGGNDSRTLSLKILELPRQPIIMSVELYLKQPKSVNMSWIAGFDGHSPLLFYHLEYRTVNQVSDQGQYYSTPQENVGWEEYRTIAANPTWFIIPNLTPASRYQFRLGAVNSVGSGEMSTAMPIPPIQMPEMPPSAPPKAFFGSPHTNTSIILRWQSPDEDTWNGNLLGYTIGYIPVRYPNISYRMKNVTDIGITQYIEHTLTELSLFQDYEIKIAAYNRMGIGVFSEAITVWTMEGVPTAPPQNVTAKPLSSTTINVTWSHPDSQQIHGINQGYKVQAARVGTGGVEVVEIMPPAPYNSQSTMLTNLRKYTEYSVTVLCYTSKGNGPESSPIILRTLEDVPGPVVELLFDSITDTSIRVMWKPPTHLNGVLQKYTLMYEMKNQSSSRQQLDLQPNNLKYTIYQLSPTTIYTIYVFAHTNSGPGPINSADIESGVPPERPGPPRNIGISNVRARTVSLQFDQGYNGRTSISNWIIEAKEEDLVGGSWEEIFEISDPDATSIIVENLHPFTNYRLRIIAVNVVGPSEPSKVTRVFQTMQDIPENPPGSLTVRAVDATSLRISWTPLSKKSWNGPPVGYRIYYRALGIEDFLLVDLRDGFNLDSHTLNNLEEWTEYEVKMLSYNDIGASDNSLIVVERTKEAVPTAGPSDVEAKALSSTSINVTWGDIPLLERNGLISGFKVVYLPTESDSAALTQDVRSNMTRWSVISGLRKYVDYNIQVLAYTRMGDGILSPLVKARTFQDVPGPPVIIWFPEVTFTTAKIVWDPPLEPNGIISLYKVSYKEQESNTATPRVAELSANNRAYTAENLKGSTNYEFSVRAQTMLGWGEEASVIVITRVNRSIPDQPSAPQILTDAIHARNVTIMWQPGQSDGFSPLRNYTIQYKRVDGEWVTFDQDIPPNLSSTAVTGLRPNTRYIFQVAATNDKGTSPYSPSSPLVKTKADKPDGAPQNVQVVPLTRTSVKVTWEQPNPLTWNGNIEGYRVQFRQTELASYQEVTVEYPDHTTILSELVKFVNYEIRIIAYNSEGEGPPSKLETVYVGEAAPTAPPMTVTTETLNSTQIHVTWQPPPPETQNGELTGYKISYWLAKPHAATALYNITRETYFTLTNLEIYSDYAISVLAYNLAGEGPSSNVTYQRTKEGLSGMPGQLIFSNITMVSLNVSWSEPAHPNGKITKYELVYFSFGQHDVQSRLVKLVIPGNKTSAFIKDLDEKQEYVFNVSARNSIGLGPGQTGSVTTGPQRGSPGAPTKPVLDVGKDSVYISWRVTSEGNSPIYRYWIEAKLDDPGTWDLIQQRNSRETATTIYFRDFNPDTTYLFRVIAFNNDGMSPPSPASEPLHSPPSAMVKETLEKPFHSEWWFQVIMALTGLVIILLLISFLCLVSRRSKKAKKTTTTSPPMEPMEGGFSSFEMRRSNRNFAGIKNGSVRNIYARSPPRPSPASVAYSDDGTVTTATKPPLAEDDSSSVSDKPSELGDSTEPSDDDSDIDSEKHQPPSSPPPPPFSATNYMREPPKQLWQPQGQYAAYSYTDSEAESSHYAMSMTGGHVVRNNTPGSRAPLPATTPDDTDGTQTEDDEDDDIPLARLAGMDFADYAGADNKLTTTAPLTEEAIVDEFQPAKDDTATATEPPEACDERGESESKPVPTLATMMDMQKSMQIYLEAQSDSAEILISLSKIGAYLCKKEFYNTV